MLRSLIVCTLIVTGGLMFDTSEAQAHRRWGVRRPIARAILGPPIIRRHWRPHRHYYHGPRVHLGVGVGYYGW